MSARHLSSKLLWLIGYPLHKPYFLAKGLSQQADRAFPFIDFLKGLSVLMVILFHVFFAIFVLFKSDETKLNQFIHAIPTGLQAVLGFDKAVDIFFLLSAFLLTYGLLKVFDKKQHIHIGRFYLHRFFRLYPLFLIALVLYGLADPNKLLTEGWYSLLFIENIFSKGIIPVQWSLSIEVQFYLVLPFLILFLIKRHHPIRWLVAIIIASVLLRFFIAYNTPSIYQTPWYAYISQVDPASYMDTMYYVIESRVSTLLLGVLWGFILWQYPHQRWTVTRWQKTVLITILSMVIYATLLYPVYDTTSSYYSPFNETLNLAIITIHRVLFTSAVLAIALLLHYTTAQPALKPASPNILIRWKGWRLFSELAYPMYFFHFPFIAIAWAIVLGTTDASQVTEILLSQVPFVFLLALLMTLYLSLWLHYWVEARFIRMGKRVESKWFSQ